jgi:hypothetical protein
MRLIGFDRLDAAQTRALGAIERAVSDLELDDVLALRLEGSRDAQ